MSKMGSAMTETSIILGRTRAVGPEAVGFCNDFREWIRFHCGSVQGAYLHMEHSERGTCEMSVVFDNEYPDEMRWAHRVRDFAEEAWEHVAHGHSVPHVLARRR